MKKNLLSAAGILLCCQVAIGHAEVVSVAAIADSVVHANSPDTISNNTTELIATKFGDPGTASTDLRFIFVQFDLPDGLTGQDILSVNSAQLQMTRASAGNLRLNYYVYGIKDGLDTASVDTYSWNTGVGYDPANTLVKFLTADEISYYSDPAESSVVGNIRTANDEGPYSPPNELPVSGPFDFTVEAQSPSYIANMSDLLKSDTDGRLTFYLGARAYFEVHSANLLASTENTQFAPPTLVLDFVRIPEPSCFVLTALAAFGVSLASARSRVAAKLV
jgi:hypothetical protein